MNSVSASSMRRPPTSRLLRWIAVLTCSRGIPYASSLLGSTVTW